MKQISTAVLGGQAWKLRYPKSIHNAYADCCPATRTIRIQANRDGLELVNLVIHEALHAMLPSEWLDGLPGDKEKIEEDWVKRSASELVRLLSACELLAEDLST